MITSARWPSQVFTFVVLTISRTLLLTVKWLLPEPNLHQETKWPLFRYFGLIGRAQKNEGEEEEERNESKRMKEKNYAIVLEKLNWKFLRRKKRDLEWFSLLQSSGQLRMFMVLLTLSQFWSKFIRIWRCFWSFLWCSSRMPVVGHVLFLVVGRLDLVVCLFLVWFDYF